MDHTTLYRKWRPRKFAEISGQEAVVRTLRRAIETDRVSHAYLFSGPRGTGKTSSAKVLAMGLNCQNSDGPTPEPCGECESCRSVVNNSSLDVVEMDAASNRGIDEIRDLRDRVNLAPASGRKKVYIIDEVHMLTTEAFNALLKMLEEPPEHAVFVLATTEKHRVLPTIISRCQSFEFRRPGVDTLSEKLAEIAEAEKIEVEPEALTIMARAGGGSFRDAEGLLDQLSSFSEGKVTAALVRELLGSAGPETVLEVTDALSERRVAEALRVLDRLSGEGRDLGRFTTEVVEHLRNVMLLPHAPEVALAEIGADERAGVEEQAKRIPTAEAVRMIEALGETGGRIRRGSDAKLELELCFVKLARDYTEPSVETLMSRLETLENAVSNGAVATPKATPPEPESGMSEPTASPSETVGASDGEASLSESVPEAEVPSESDSDETRESSETVSEPPEDSSEPSDGDGMDLTREWPAVMQELKRRKQALTAAVYEQGRVESSDGTKVVISFPGGTSDSIIKMARDKRHVESISRVLSEKYGLESRVEVSAATNSGASAAKPTGETRAPTPPPKMHDEEPPPEENAPPNSYDSAPEVSGIGERSGAADGVRDGERQDVIRSEQQVFQIAREHFDLS